MPAPLLLDENLSPRLVNSLASQFPGSIHVRDAGLKGQSDEKIWSFAANKGLIITTKDDDFRSLSLLLGAPPKVIWLVVGNTSTAEILCILLANATAITAFIAEPTTALLTLRRP
ncbi:MAG: hypothetical protein FJ062_01655 [Cyanobacteria bacterium M_DeepCast_100m_m1_067]|nr:hypothetical protein [Cyanobacteria bacterium M_DeepCast_100m_m1_067]